MKLNALDVLLTAHTEKDTHGVRIVACGETVGHINTDEIEASNGEAIRLSMQKLATQAIRALGGLK